MSADSPLKSRRSHTTGLSATMGPAVISPQHVSDKTLFDSVAAVINEVVPTSYGGTIDPKEQIQWARFEIADANDPTLRSSLETDSTTPPPLLLILGYGTGVQVWSISPNGEATEVLSWRQGAVRVLRVLPNPSNESCYITIDQFAQKRPLIALCDTIAPGPHFCSLGFISLKDGDQVKSIQFKNPILDVLANRSSVVVTFSERIAVFDAHTLEDKLTVTTCYPSPGLSPNPVALGTRWLAYSERTLISTWRSSGGSNVEGVQSYTATVIHAAKSIGKGLRELGESVANSLTGSTTVNPTLFTNPNNDGTHPGIVTILDLQAPQETNNSGYNNKLFPSEAVLAHFNAHSEPIVSMAFDPTGLLLFTADKRGHDFHIFKIHTHPCGSSLAAVHHLYVLHRGDTTSKVQDVCFSFDSRWVAVSTLRGTTHVFPITPYGGPVGVRTHSTPHVVNRLSRFHRSAGLSADGRSNSPVTLTDIPSAVPYANPCLPPFPHPNIVYPLAQIRQPSQFGPGVSLQANIKSSTCRQRLTSTSEDAPNLKLCAVFAPARAWLLDPREPNRLKLQKPAVDSLFVMACHGSLIQYDLEPKHISGIPKEKVCDDTSIELFVEAKARWNLLRQPHSCEIQGPLSNDNPLLNKNNKNNGNQKIDNEDRWLSQVEIVTHAGPHRRLWMGPQFLFKTYNTPNSVPLTCPSDVDAVEVSVGAGSRPARSNPVNMPHGGIRMKPSVPVLIESTSVSSCEQSPRLRRDSDSSTGELQLREDLADAMMESGVPTRESGMSLVIVQMKQPAVAKVVNPLGTVITLPSDDEYEKVSADPVSDSYVRENADEMYFRPIVIEKDVSEEKTKHKVKLNTVSSSVVKTETDVRNIKKDAMLAKLKSDVVKKVNVRDADEKKVKSADIDMQCEQLSIKNKKVEKKNSRDELFKYEKQAPVQSDTVIDKKNDRSSENKVTKYAKNKDLFQVQSDTVLDKKNDRSSENKYAKSKDLFEVQSDTVIDKKTEKASESKVTKYNKNKDLLEVQSDTVLDKKTDRSSENKYAKSKDLFEVQSDTVIDKKTEKASESKVTKYNKNKELFEDQSDTALDKKTDRSSEHKYAKSKDLFEVQSDTVIDKKNDKSSESKVTKYTKNKELFEDQSENVINKKIDRGSENKYTKNKDLFEVQSDNVIDKKTERSNENKYVKSKDLFDAQSENVIDKKTDKTSDSKVTKYTKNKEMWEVESENAIDKKSDKSTENKYVKSKDLFDVNLGTVIDKKTDTNNENKFVKSKELFEETVIDKKTDKGSENKISKQAKSKDLFEVQSETVIDKKNDKSSENKIAKSKDLFEVESENVIDKKSDKNIENKVPKYAKNKDLFEVESESVIDKKSDKNIENKVPKYAKSKDLFDVSNTDNMFAKKNETTNPFDDILFKTDAKSEIPNSDSAFDIPSNKYSDFPALSEKVTSATKYKNTKKSKSKLSANDFDIIPDNNPPKKEPSKEIKVDNLPEESTSKKSSDVKKDNVNVSENIFKSKWGNTTEPESSNFESAYEILPSKNDCDFPALSDILSNTSRNKNTKKSKPKNPWSDFKMTDMTAKKNTPKDTDFEFLADDTELLKPESKNVDAEIESFHSPDIDFVCEIDDKNLVEKADQDCDEQFLSLETDLPDLPLPPSVDMLEFISEPTNDESGKTSDENTPVASSSQTESDDSTKLLLADTPAESVVTSPDESNQVKNNKKKSKKKRR